MVKKIKMRNSNSDRWYEEGVHKKKKTENKST